MPNKRKNKGHGVNKVYKPLIKLYINKGYN
jgi:hypothetical protein